jgi:GNAT superfamily N-acetyltransferase
VTDVSQVTNAPDVVAPGAIAVREATPDDAQAIRAVAEAAWRATYVGLVTDDAIERFLAQAYAPERVAVRVERHDILVAGRATDPGLCDVEAFAECLVRDGHVQLVAMYAHPEARGQGLGTALLGRVQQRNPGLDIAADVLVGNERGEPFYAARGFEPGQLLVEELAGEPIRERRWWLRAGR